MKEYKEENKCIQNMQGMDLFCILEDKRATTATKYGPY